MTHICKLKKNSSYKPSKHSLISDRILSFSLFLLNWIIRATDKKCNKSLDDESDQNWSFYTTFNIYENAIIEKEKFAVMKSSSDEDEDPEMTSTDDNNETDREWIEINESIITLLFKLYLKVIIIYSASSLERYTFIWFSYGAYHMELSIWFL